MAPRAHLPCSILLVNIVNQLVRQGLEVRPAPGTGQHRQAAEGGQEPPHFGIWILDSPRKERTQDIRLLLLYSVSALNTQQDAISGSTVLGPDTTQWPKDSRSCPGYYVPLSVPHFPLLSSLGVAAGNLKDIQCPWTPGPCLKVPTCAHSTWDCAMSYLCVPPTSPKFTVV